MSGSREGEAVPPQKPEHISTVVYIVFVSKSDAGALPLLLLLKEG